MLLLSRLAWHKKSSEGDRLAIYDQDSGLLARWYFELRLVEETRRCQRYELPRSF